MQNRKADRKSAKWTVLVVVLLLCFALLVGYSDTLRERLLNEPEGDCVKVHFLDVGQGACTLIQSGREGILIDAGEREYADRVVSYLRRAGIRKLSLVVASHPHTDHIGALPEVLSTFPADALLIPRLTQENTPDSYAYERLLETVKEQSIRLVAAKPGAEYALEHAALHILAPLEQSANLNDMSVVCRLVAFETVLLLTADAEIAAQETLLRSNADLRCDVLQAPHHGSSGALDPAFLDAASPQAAVISCGAGNDYGHPHAEVLEALEHRQCKVYRTDLQSHVVVRCYEDGYRIDTDS